MSSQPESPRAWVAPVAPAAITGGPAALADGPHSDSSSGGPSAQPHERPKKLRKKRPPPPTGSTGASSASASDDEAKMVRQERSEEPGRRARRPRAGPERPARDAADDGLLTTRTGGAYIPPAKLRLLQAQITDRNSLQFQRLAWEALKKSINGLINKVNTPNIGVIVRELFGENIVRGRGLLCQAIMTAQTASPTFTHVYAALGAIVNSKFPNIGELLLKRLILNFKRGFKRSDKTRCMASTRFVAHFVNQQVAHEVLALEILTLLLETPTDDSVEVAITFLKECGQKLSEVSPRGIHAIFERLRHVLHESLLDKRTQYMIEVMFQVRKDGFKDNPSVMEDLDLVEEDDQFTHMITLDDATTGDEILNVFKHDPAYQENEEKFKAIKRELLDEDSDSGSGGGKSGSGSSDSESEEDEEKELAAPIIDQTETNMIALRRTIYLTLQSSLDFEEAAHKLLKMNLKPGHEKELCHMILDCCAQQRTYEKYYGLLAQRFCQINRVYVEPFQSIFESTYNTVHRLEIGKLRNVARLFAHLLFTDAIAWEVLSIIHLNEHETTSSSRIYIKILFQELAEYMGAKKLVERTRDATLQTAFEGVFPRDDPANTRFSINFFTSIGLGILTEDLRVHLKANPKRKVEISSSSSSSSSDSSSSSSSSSSEEERRLRRKKAKKAKESKREEETTPKRRKKKETSPKRRKEKDASPKRRKEEETSPKRRNEEEKENVRRSSSRPKERRRERERTRDSSEEKIRRRRRH